MLTTSASLKIDTEGVTRDIMVTPLFLQNHNQPWQPNEIYEITQVFELPKSSVASKTIEPLGLGKIIVDENMDWHYDGEHGLTEEEVEQIAQFVLRQV